MVVGVLAVAGASAARGAVVTLDLQLNAGAGTWDLYATVSNDSRGLASFNVDVTGAGGASVTSSLLKAPRPLNGMGDQAGFISFRNNGTLGVEIRASQDTVSGDANLILLDQGVGSAVYLASGTFSGTVGSLTAALHPSAFFNVFPTGYTSGGSTVAATGVVPETVAVPEPGAVALAAVGAVMLGRRRARRV
jgi:hypothetical protein